MAEEKEFLGKVALITGGASGIGRAAAVAFAEKGAAVYLGDVNKAGLSETLALVEASGSQGGYAVTDVADEEAVATMVDGCVSQFGRLDFALNNAGIGGAQAFTSDYPTETFKQVMAINVTGVYYCLKHELRIMEAQGSGSIVNLASVAGLVGFPRHSAYAASKHAVIGLTRTAALEYVRRGIRVNAVCPGFTDTPMVQQLTAQGPEYAQRLLQGIPIRRLGQPAEIASAIVYLCSAGAAFMTGQAMALDGGITAG